METDLGKIAYEAWLRAICMQDTFSAPLRNWESLPDSDRKAWRQVADAAIDKFNDAFSE
jgi:hypothetical protein